MERLIRMVVLVVVVFAACGKDKAPLVPSHTGDNVVGSYVDYAYDGNGNMIRRASCAGPGKDGLWFTSDDVVSYVGYAYDAENRMMRETSYSGPGPDGQWFTLDDVTGGLRIRFKGQQNARSEIHWRGSGRAVVHFG